ncbi:MAG: hypothetical protein HY617_00135 [Candidatus Sungbacteria bacterium]|nr:hypothetical protein [Candidatus Sungbacteria bacterium]
MGEKFSSPESQEVEVLRQKVIEGLRKKGIDDPEVYSALNKWTQKREMFAEAVGTRAAQILFELDRAALYHEGGYTEEALEVLYDARTIAEQEGEVVWLDEVERKIREIEN